MSLSDSEDSQLEAKYMKVVDEVIQQLPTKKTTRANWPKIDRHQRVGGKQVVVHPFLSADNDMDKIVVRHLIIDEPYLSKHGDVSKAWSDCANNIKLISMPSMDESEEELSSRDSCSSNISEMRI
jgi:hypothetical protein